MYSVRAGFTTPMSRLEPWSACSLLHSCNVELYLLRGRWLPLDWIMSMDADHALSIDSSRRRCRVDEAGKGTKCCLTRSDVARRVRIQTSGSALVLRTIPIEDSIADECRTIGTQQRQQPSLWAASQPFIASHGVRSPRLSTA